MKRSQERESYKSWASEIAQFSKLTGVIYRERPFRIYIYTLQRATFLNYPREFLPVMCVCVYDALLYANAKMEQFPEVER